MRYVYDAQNIERVMVILERRSQVEAYITEHIMDIPVTMGYGYRDATYK